MKKISIENYIKCYSKLKEENQKNKNYEIKKILNRMKIIKIDFPELILEKFIKLNKNNKAKLYLFSVIDYNDKKDKEYLLIKRYFSLVIKKILQHPRFNNPVYTSREYKLNIKNTEKLTALLKRVNGKNYLKWFLNFKASKMPGFSIGLFAHPPIIDEYLQKNKKRILSERKTKQNKIEIKNKKQEFNKKIINEIKEKIKRKEGLTKIEKEIYRRYKKND